MQTRQTEGHGCEQIIEDGFYSNKRDTSVRKATKYDETTAKDFLTADEFIERNDMCSVQDMKG